MLPTEQNQIIVRIALQTAGVSERVQWKHVQQMQFPLSSQLHRQPVHAETGIPALITHPAQLVVHPISATLAFRVRAAKARSARH